MTKRHQTGPSPKRYNPGTGGGAKRQAERDKAKAEFVKKLYSKGKS